ncbi:glycosyltransferase family 4 protein [Neoroseomonas rubea]|uniref:glycosyltransferase family 4 protein n=1 Tax=Neoroseomonas rubea TaxID=2748666 RepID=UPI0018DFCBF0|nr:glycosyltransferase family 4 protein [Roseomonas rubea]
MRLLIEGWRNISHSYALVNQFQIVALARMPGITLFHEDQGLPANWDAKTNPAGFPAADAALIAGLGPPDGPVDAVYRCAWPFSAGAAEDRRRRVTYMITEMGLGTKSLIPADPAAFTRGDRVVVTPTAWSRDRIVEHGIDPAGIHLVPHAVDAAAFRPMGRDERAAVRARLGIAEDEVLLLNVGGAFWNKGIDRLLEAFAVLRARGRRVRLVLKDLSGLYGVGVKETIAQTAPRCPALLEENTISAISVIQGSLEREALRELYCAADAYVSPYRAEGFNLPVLEAISCARPVIVTEGGATADFCPAPLARTVAATPGTLDREPGCPPGRYLEPDLDALVAAIEGIAPGMNLSETAMAARAGVLAHFSWETAARGIMDLAAQGAHTAGEFVPAPPRAAPSQPEVLDLLARMHPRAMAAQRKVRVGNAWDGGYVLPEAALRAEVVLSIGVGNDVSFDFAMAERGAQVLQFDHTVEAPPTAHPNFQFRRAGWGAETAGPLLSFAELHAATEAVPGAHRMLKFDVEGAEYEALAATDTAQLAAYEVIVCELHDLNAIGTAEGFDRLARCLDALTRHHEPVHLHANNYAGMALVQGVPVPQVVELTLLRRDLDAFGGPSGEPMPGPLDRPNHPALPDLCLTPFGRMVEVGRAA